jgi:hypothetical protein
MTYDTTRLYASVVLQVSKNILSPKEVQNENVSQKKALRKIFAQKSSA